MVLVTFGVIKGVSVTIFLTETELEIVEVGLTGSSLVDKTDVELVILLLLEGTSVIPEELTLLGPLDESDKCAENVEVESSISFKDDDIRLIDFEVEIVLLELFVPGLNEEWTSCSNKRLTEVEIGSKVVVIWVILETFELEVIVGNDNLVLMMVSLSLVAKGVSFVGRDKAAELIIVDCSNFKVVLIFEDWDTTSSLNRVVSSEDRLNNLASNESETVEEEDAPLELEEVDDTVVTFEVPSNFGSLDSCVSEVIKLVDIVDEVFSLVELFATFICVETDNEVEVVEVIIGSKLDDCIDFVWEVTAGSELEIVEIVDGDSVLLSVEFLNEATICECNIEAEDTIGEIIFWVVNLDFEELVTDCVSEVDIVMSREDNEEVMMLETLVVWILLLVNILFDFTVAYWASAANSVGTATLSSIDLVAKELLTRVDMSAYDGSEEVVVDILVIDKPVVELDRLDIKGITSNENSPR